MNVDRTLERKQDKVIRSNIDVKNDNINAFPISDDLNTTVGASMNLHNFSSSNGLGDLVFMSDFLHTPNINLHERFSAKRKGNKAHIAIDNDTGKKVVEVSSHIMRTGLPKNFINYVLGRPKDRHNRVNGDIHATVFSSNADLLLALGVFEGSICALSLSPSPIQDNSCANWAPVIIRVIPSGSNSREETAHKIDNNNNAEETYSDDIGKESFDSLPKNKVHDIFIPPCIAAFIGLSPELSSSFDSQDTSPFYDQLQRLAYISPIPSDTNRHMSFHKSPQPTKLCDNFIPTATKASLQEVAMPCSDYLPTIESLHAAMELMSLPPPNETDSEQRDGADESQGPTEDDAIRAKRSNHLQTLKGAIEHRKEQQVHDLKLYFSTEKIVRNNLLIGIDPINSIRNEESISKPYTRRCISHHTRFYIIQQIETKSTDNSNIQNYGNDTIVRISPDTELVLLPNDYSTDRLCNLNLHNLPSISAVRNFYQSCYLLLKEIRDGKQVGTASTCISKDIYRAPFHHVHRYHPSIPDLIYALSSRGSFLNKKTFNFDPLFHTPLSLNTPMGTETLFANHVIHLIGGKENNLDECLSATADLLGSRILHVRGLAAFYFRHHIYSNTIRNQSISTSNSLLGSGSILEKLSGIQGSFEIARMCLPCILHLSLDGELVEESLDGPGGNARNDEENRFISCIEDELVKLVYGNETDSGFEKSFCLVLSSSNALQNGPLAEKLAMYGEEISMTLPNEEYARNLWNQNLPDNMSTPSDVSDGHNIQNIGFEVVNHYLIGRSAQEIEIIRDEFEERSKNRKKNEVKSIMEEIMQDLDGMNRSNSPIQSAISFRCTNKTQTSTSLIPDVRWEDVGGLSYVRREVSDVIELPLKYPELFYGENGSGSKRSGILFFGPPGSGKTLVAKAIATEYGFPFLSVKGPELLGSYVGESEANVRNVFDSARLSATPYFSSSESNIVQSKDKASILFFDEIDSIAPRRGGVGDGGGVMERVVATLLGELDKNNNITDDDGSTITVFVIAATNRPDLLEPALLRPGRFDRKVYLGLAQKREDRISILAAQTRKFKFENGLNAFEMADLVIDEISPSLSGADFSAVASGALALALKRLCDLADAELLASSEIIARDDDGNENDLKQNNQINDKGMSAADDVERIISTWSEEKRVPIVTAEDLISVSKEIVPSVSEEDLKGYEDLRNQFCDNHN